MTYEEFVLRIREQVAERVPGSTTVIIQKETKNNGTRRTGLTLKEPGVNIAPTIFLEEFYQRFSLGVSEERLVKEVVDLYGKLRFEQPCEVECLKHFATVKDRIVYRLVDQKANEEMLKDLPNRPFLDLAVVYYVVLEAGEHGMASVMIRKEHMAVWDVSEEMLYRCACRNTRRIFPEEFATMQAVIRDLTGQREEKPEPVDVMYVLTNRLRSHGAACILYDGCLERIARELSAGFFVLPSSVHEVIIIPEGRGFSYEGLSEMVKEINETQVDPEEVLSDHAYFYDMVRRELTCF